MARQCVAQGTRVENHCYSLIIRFEMRKYKTSNFVFLSQNCFALLSPLNFHIFPYNLFNVCRVGNYISPFFPDSANLDLSFLVSLPKVLSILLNFSKN